MTDQIMIEIGHSAPAFSLMSDEKNCVNLPDLLRGQDLLLAFIHGTWCPHCVQTLYRLRRAATTFSSAGIGIAVVAIDAPDALNIFRRTAEPSIPFVLLADEDEVAHKSYGLQHLSAYIALNNVGIVRAVFLDKDHHSYPGHTAIIQSLRSTP